MKPSPQNSDQEPSDGAAAPADGRPVGSLYLKLSVFLAGACIMSAEMAAPRLLAPYFGTSQIIWANIIGTVLAAMTVGAFVGGRLADRWPNEAAYGRAIAIGGVSLAVVPLLSPPLLRAATGALASKSVATFLLSLAAVCLFFAPPVFVLGMVSPWAVKLAGAGRRDLGRVAGVLSGLGAGGSIFGTFFSALVLLPFLGTRRTILATAALLVATGAWRAFGDVRVRIGAIVLAALLVFHSFGTIKKSTGLVYETESFYQYIQVRRSRRGSTILQLNE
ncbi:MAG: fused MFS/spermidine synthase, partial [Planctomycetota bacterium]